MANPVLSVRAITPRNDPMATTKVFKLVERHLGQLGFAGDMIRAMADYPQQETATGAAQSLGARFGAKKRKGSKVGRKGYKRTGTLGRGWKIGRRRRGRTITSIEVINRVRYAVHVQGPRRGAKGRRQTADMRRRGWPNITTESKRVWRKHRVNIIRIITQRDPRVRPKRSSV